MAKELRKAIMLRSKLKNVFNKSKTHFNEVRNSRVTKSSYETELRRMTSYFELLTRKFLQEFFFRVTNSTS